MKCVPWPTYLGVSAGEVAARAEAARALLLTQVSRRPACSSPSARRPRPASQAPCTASRRPRRPGLRPAGRRRLSAARSAWPRSARVAFAVEMAAAARTGAERQARPPARALRRGGHGGQLRWWLAGAGAVASGLVITLMVLLLPGGRQAGSVPAAVAAVARYAQAIPPRTGEQHPQRAAPVEVGHPVTVTAGGQRIVLRTWRLG